MSDNKAQFNFYLNRQGVTGKQGAKGEKGFSPVISVEKDTLSEYILRITNESSYFLTTNLRESKEDRGGTYIRYDRDQGVMYAGDADRANKTQYGEVRFATAEEIAAGDESTVITPADLEDATINMVTTNTDQTITGNKSFSAPIKTNTIEAIDGTSLLSLSGGKVSLGTPGNVSSPLVSKVSIKGNSINIAGKNFTFTDLLNTNITYPVLHSGNLENYIQAGDNITIDKTATGITINSTGGSGGTDDYTQLTNKPQINGVELTGNKNGNDLGLANESEIEELGNKLNQLANDVTNLDTKKQDKLVAGTGITISGNNEIYLDRTSYINNSINYVNKDTSYGEIKNNIFYQLQNNSFNNPVDGFKSLGFNIPSEQINSFDFIVCVKLVSPYTDNNGNIMRIGLGNTEVYVDTLYGSQSGGKLRFGTTISGTGKAFLNTEISDTQYTLLRLKHIGTDNTLRIYSLLSDIAKLPEEDEWISVGTVDWDISQYQPSSESGDLHLQELFSIGGANITNLGEDKTYGMQSGNYYLAFTRLIVNENIIFNGTAISNPAEATKDEYGLVKIDFSTITINSSGQLQANIPDNLITQGNTFNGANQLVQLDGNGKLPAIDGSQLINLPSSTPSNMVTTNTAQDITANKTFKEGVLIFYYNNKPSIAVGNVPASISISYEGNTTDDSAHILRDTMNDWRVGRYNKQGVISSSAPLKRMGAAPYFNTYPILDTSNLGSYVDGTTITYTDGKLKASGSSVPDNMVTTDTNQTITGIKTFPAYTKFNDTIQFTGSLCRIQNEYGNVLFLDDRVGNTIQVGEEGRTTILSNTVQNGSGKKFLVQGSITSGSDNLVISETADGIQIASTNNTGTLKYWTGAEPDYTAIETKDADTLYRTTDTNKVFLGTIQIGGNA